MARSWGRLLAKIAGYGILVVLVLAALAITFTVGWRPVIGAKKRALTSRKFEATPARMRAGIIWCTPSCIAWDATRNTTTKRTHRCWLPRKAPAKSYLKKAIFAWSRPISLPIRKPASASGAMTPSPAPSAKASRLTEAALFPVMPYEHFRDLSDEDLASIVVFLRSVPPAHSDLPPNKIPFLFARLIQAAPQPVTEPVPEPDMSTPAKYGAYLVRMATCSDCHTPLNPKFQPIPGLEMAGGNPMEKGVNSANLTPDPSGIGYYDEALFVQTMRTGSVRARKLNSAMPWWVFRNMTDDDLKAMFAYLRTLKPVHHLVDNTEPPTKCKLCGQKHGLGDRN